MSSLNDTPNDTIGVKLNRHKLDLSPGALVASAGVIYRIKEVLDFNSVVGTEVESGRTRALRISELSAITHADKALSELSAQDIDDISDADWQTANKRLTAIQPMLDGTLTSRKAIEQHARDSDVHIATLYRWLQRYQGIGTVLALLPKQRGWVTGNPRVSREVEDIMQEVINDTYLTIQRTTAEKTVREVQRRCLSRGIQPPHPNTVRARINAIHERRRLFARGFQEKAQNKYQPTPGRFPNADYPLAVVQIDHTPLDIILVDDVYRLPIDKAWLTLAIDVFSRMILGYHLSLDPPSTTSVAMCIAHAILKKEEWLELHDVETEWNCWGIMTKIHVDNGAEFRSNTFRKACLVHDIQLEFRPVKQPRFGGHIERLLGTVARELHDIPGTTFSSVEERGSYASEKHATMTKSDLEKWLITYFCDTYHQRVHTTIGMPPARKWEIGIFGKGQIEGRGLPAVPPNKQALLLDFLPSFERTIQTYGIAIEGIKYYSEVLRSWVNASDPKNPKSKRKFTFRQDPRDISCIWFYDPNINEYFKIPSAFSFPQMSIWEHRQARKQARKEGMQSVNEHQLLKSHTKLAKIVQESQEKTKRARRQNQRRREHQKNISPANPIAATNEAQPLALAQSHVLTELTDDDIQPFDDIA